MEKDPLIIMQEDLQRALKKGRDFQWAMLIDLRRCVGCHACTVGCIAENKSAPKMQYRPVYEVVEGKFPKLKRIFVPRPCQHCDEPPCVKACPTKGKAIFKAKEGIEEGLVLINYNECISCGRCLAACPYGAPTLDNVGYHAQYAPFIPEAERGPTWEYGKVWIRKGVERPMGASRKCHFCLHRLKEGLLPICVTTCIGRATFFGDLKDPQSLINRLVVKNRLRISTLAYVKEHIDTAKEAKGADYKLAKENWRRLVFKALEVYPGATPIFGESFTKPRVLYIL